MGLSALFDRSLSGRHRQIGRRAVRSPAVLHVLADGAVSAAISTHAGPSGFLEELGVGWPAGGTTIKPLPTCDNSMSL